MAKPDADSPERVHPTAGGAAIATELSQGDTFAQEIERGLAVARRVLRTFSDISAEDADDLVQEMTISYWEHRSGVMNIEAWFFICTRNLAYRFVIRRHRRPRLVPLESATLSQPPAQESCDPFLQQLFFTLSDHCRRLLGCLVVQEWTPKELAEATGRKPRDLVSMGSRCLKALRARWNAIEQVRRGADKDLG